MRQIASCNNSALLRLLPTAHHIAYSLSLHLYCSLSLALSFSLLLRSTGCFCLCRRSHLHVKMSIIRWANASYAQCGRSLRLMHPY